MKTAKLLLAIALSFIALSVSAQLSFECTNYLPQGVLVLSYPTNATGKVTGHGVDCRSWSQGNIQAQATILPNVNYSNQSISGSIILQLVRSGKDSATVYSDWETAPLAASTLTIAYTATNNITWFTNAAALLSVANQVGIYSATNTSPYFDATNFVVTVNGKIVRTF